MSAELQLKAARRLLAIKEARESLLGYLRLSMPDPEDIDDVTKSKYQVTPLARLLCEIMEKVARGEMKRVAVSVGPQMGKSQVLSRAFPAWMAGLNPAANIILGTYNQPFAEEFGDSVRELMGSNFHRQVFPNAKLRKGGAAKDLLITTENGRLAFVGRGGSGTGKPADIFIVDDPLKDDTEAQSNTTREETWKWFNKVAFTRCHDDSRIVVVHTRWHGDDLIGRLCDPDHPEREKLYAGIADDWTYINLPAVVTDPKLAHALGLTLTIPEDPRVVTAFGARPMSSIWPGRKSLPLLAEAKRMDEAGFNALYMGRPTPDDGDYFKAEYLVEYERDELPDNLRIYGASDHAVSEKQQRDYTVLGCVGVDERDDIWVLPDLVWDRMPTDRTVEEMLHQFQTHRPLLWWMESELISKSFGPFLRKRMMEEQAYVTIDPVVPSKDKQTRARAVQGRMQMRKVRFPKFAHWWPEARKQLLRFPFGANDDFVDWLSHIGMGLQKEIGAAPRRIANDNGVTTGSIKWILQQTAAQEAKKRRLDRGGW